MLIASRQQNTIHNRGADRECIESVTLQDGTRILKGFSVHFPLWFLHRDPSVYDEPMRFLPDRWLQASQNASKWMPFGAGPRQCIGMRFAMIEARMALASLVRRFELHACERTDRDELETGSRFGLTYAKNGVWIQLRERERGRASMSGLVN